MDLNYDYVYLYVSENLISAKSFSRSSKDFSITLAEYNDKTEAKEALELCTRAYVEDKKIFRFPPRLDKINGE